MSLSLYTAIYTHARMCVVYVLDTSPKAVCSVDVLKQTLENVDNYEDPPVDEVRTKLCTFWTGQRIPCASHGCCVSLNQLEILISRRFFRSL